MSEAEAAPDLWRRAFLFSGATLALSGVARANAEAPGLATPDLFTTWRKMFASAVDGEIYWWSFGAMAARVDGVGDVPALRTEAVRVCRVQSTDETVTVRWKEIGAYIDPATDLPAATWLNPVTGANLPVARAYEEGVGVYTLPRHGALTLTQRWARPWRTEAVVRIEGTRIILDQSELKTRAFPYADGESVDITEPNAVVNDFRFQLSADLAEVFDPARSSVAAAARFSTLFGGAPSWMVFPGRVTRAIARGVMVKTPPTVDAFPAARARLQAVHPDYFRKGAISWD